MPKNKTNSFLKAIKKHAQAQKNAMQSKVEQLKSERLKEAEDKAKLDSERLIKKELNEKRNKETALLAAKTQESQRKLFIERSAMMDEVFEITRKKLTDFTQTDEYRSKLTQSAEQIADLFEGKDCVISLSESDMDKAEELRALFKGKTEVKSDKTIVIGGIRGYCKALGIIADETLDSKLDAQREWFTENATLSVL